MTLIALTEDGVQYSPLKTDPRGLFLRPYFESLGDCFVYALQTGRNVQLSPDESADVHADFHAAVAPRIQALRKERIAAYQSAQHIVLK